MPPPPAITVDSDGHQWVFVRGTNGALFAKQDDLSWVSLGGIITSGPDAMATGGWTSLGGLS